MNRITLLARSLMLSGSSLLLALTALGCSSDPGPAVEVPAGPQYVDLFACNVPLACPMYCAHLGIETCMPNYDPPTCAGDLWLAGTAGAVMLQDRPGPGSWAGDDLTLLLGNGKALVQKRERTCPDAGIGCDLSKVPWELGPHELCDVEMPPATCTMGNCPQLPSVENCVAVEKDWTCDEAKSAATAM
jgi:hypothetical protein